MNQKLEEIKRMVEDAEREYESACKSLVIGEPGKQLLTREEVYYEKLFRVRTHQLATHCLAAIEQAEKLAEALNTIAQWYDGPEVGSHFDEPGSANTAREALAEFEKWKRGEK